MDHYLVVYMRRLAKTDLRSRIPAECLHKQVVCRHPAGISSFPNSREMQCKLRALGNTRLVEQDRLHLALRLSSRALISP